MQIHLRYYPREDPFSCCCLKRTRRFPCLAQIKMERLLCVQCRLRTCTLAALLLSVRLQYCMLINTHKKRDNTLERLWDSNTARGIIIRFGFFKKNKKNQCLSPSSHPLKPPLLMIPVCLQAATLTPCL